MATITDIANAANVSISTVSRVLNYDESLSVTDETRRKIFETAENLNYTKYKKKKRDRDQKAAKIAANAASPALQGTIGILLWRTDEEELDDIYYMSIRLGVEKKASELGYNVVKLYQLDDNLTTNLDGIIAIGKFDAHTLEHIQTLNHNICVIGTNFPINNFDSVNTDFSQATDLALNHLLSLGHERIAFIGAEENQNMYGYREYKTPTILTYLDIMKNKNLFSEDYFFVQNEKSLNVEVAKTLTKVALKKWKNNMPSAILGLNDSVAIAIINTLQEEGFRIPEDISVMGINDISISQYVSPPLTTVKAFTEEMGETGIEILHEQINKPSINKRIFLETELVIRQSTARYEA
ncbi:LacI family DNA-binding transcriptional regulator [Vagococcus silagei]|uniref:LacI family DNA-binding transcriptional regulator n=1 Tax=Vagococcus silagei TaxID=2508885 RepID=A0A4S3B4I0_9ENTE|nr:LacI family DNA-binding transcriptional regulator [Vagococcus silagei]THB61187.1 LacI family DNA-binding transcriptional regulator [Vagococcus silagei]